MHASVAALSARASPPGDCAAVGLTTSRPRAATAALGRPASLHVCAAALHTGDSAAHTCSLCDVHATFAAQLQCHLNGRRHAKAVRRAEAPEFAARAEASLDSLETMNNWLKRLGYENAASKSAARRELQQIHINIYDLVNNRLEPVFETVPQLRKYSQKQDKIFPLEEAKESAQLLKLFLRHFY